MLSNDESGISGSWTMSLWIKSITGNVDSWLQSSVRFVHEVLKKVMAAVAAVRNGVLELDQEKL